MADSNTMGQIIILETHEKSVNRHLLELGH